MANALLEMIERFSERPQRKIARLCEPLFQTFGLSHFFHQRIDDKSRFYGLGTNPDFLNFYLDKKLHEINPFITNFHNLQTGIYFFHSNKQDDFHSSMDAIEEKYSIKHSVLIVDKNKDYCDQYGFAIPPNKNHLDSLFVNELPLIKEFTKYFVGEMAPELKLLKQNAINI